jgi:predicted transcriptional regulator
MAEGSLGLALLLWVLSIDSIDKQSLQVNPLVPVNDVLRGVESNKLSILHALVLHDGLGIKELNEVLNFHISKTRNLLSSLEKDGVVENKNDFLKINPLLHWSAVNAMNKRNVIH